MSYSYVVVGAGIAGCTVADQLANRGESVLLIEKSNHIGGTCADGFNPEYRQEFGPHIFHTRTKEVYDYLSRFTELNDYKHLVLSYVNGKYYSFPVSIVTLEEITGNKMSILDAKEYFDKHRVPISNPANAEEAVLCRFGQEIYDMFFKGYTEKQWGVQASELSPDVTMRIPFRMNYDKYYFPDQMQGIPFNGFSAMMTKMIFNINIELQLNSEYRGIKDVRGKNGTIFTGRIDQYFEYKYGELEYRKLYFRHETIERQQDQPSAVVNYPELAYQYTRKSDFNHFIPTKTNHGNICTEFPLESGIPCYPMQTKKAKEQYQKYKEEADKLNDVYFVGRLAEYKYLDIDQVVCNAINLVKGLR